MKRMLTLSAILAVLLTATVQPASAKMRIGWQTGDVQVLLSYLDKTGAFGKVGLDYSMHAFPAGPSMLPALAANEVDIAWMGEFPAVTGYSNGIPLSIFMVEQEWKAHIRLVVQPDSGIKDLAGLKGKKIGVTFGSSGHNHILRALDKAGLTAKDVTLVNLQPGHMPGAFEKKSIDAALTWESNVSVIEKAGGVRIATTESIGTTLIGVWVARHEYMKSNQGDIQKFLKAWEAATNDFRTKRLEVLKYEAERLRQTPQEMSDLVDRQQAVRPTYAEQLTTSYLGKPGDQQNSRLMKHFKEVAQFMVDLERIKAAPSDWGGIVDVEPLATYLKGKK